MVFIDYITREESIGGHPMALRCKTGVEERAHTKAVGHT